MVHLGSTRSSDLGHRDRKSAGVPRLMRRAGLEGRCKKRWRKTTIQDPAASAADLDLIQGAFDVDGELDVSYCGDITYTRGAGRIWPR